MQHFLLGSSSVFVQKKSLGLIVPNKALHLTAITMRSIAAGELER